MKGLLCFLDLFRSKKNNKTVKRKKSVKRKRNNNKSQNLYNLNSKNLKKLIKKIK